MASQSNTQRIVVIRPGALGDTLLTFPALVWLRNWAPQARLTLIARGDTLGLALASGLADAAYSYDLPDWAALFADPAQAEYGGVESPTAPSVAANLASGATPRTSPQPPTRSALTPLAHATLDEADLVVAWLADADGRVARNLRAFGVRRIIVAPGRPSDCPAMPPSSSLPTWHTARYLLDTLLNDLTPLDSPIAGDTAGLRALLPTLAPSAEDTQAAASVWRRLGLPVAPQAGMADEGSTRAPEIAATAGRVIALHPGSGGAAKRWSAPAFAALAERIAQAGDLPLLIEGPQDVAVVLATTAAWADRERRDGVALPVARGLGVGALAALLLRCDGYVGNDAGVTHLAGLLGAPTVALFGPTDPTIWAPIGRAVWVVRAPADDLARLTPTQVWATLAQALASGRP